MVILNNQQYRLQANSIFPQIKIPLSKAIKKNSPKSKVTPNSPDSKKTKEGGDGSDSEALPDYLPEDDDDECKPENDPKSAVAPTGAAFKEAASSLFSAAASLLQQSFYW